MKNLSGGQKVKCVIGASMWFCPHIVVLDEPTNYLQGPQAAKTALTGRRSQAAGDRGR